MVVVHTAPLHRMLHLYLELASWHGLRLANTRLGLGIGFVTVGLDYKTDYNNH